MVTTSMKDNNGDMRWELLAIEPKVSRTIHQQPQGEGEGVLEDGCPSPSLPYTQRHPAYVMGQQSHRTYFVLLCSRSGTARRP